MKVPAVVVGVVLAALALQSRAADPRRVVDVEAKIDVSQVNAGEPIPIRVTIRNRTPWDLRYCAYSLDNARRNGETLGLVVRYVYWIPPGGSGRRVPLTVEAPEVGLLSLPPSQPLPRGRAITLHTDLTKWRIGGGWVRGAYDVALQVTCLHPVHDGMTSLVSAAPKLLVEVL